MGETRKTETGTGARDEAQAGGAFCRRCGRAVRSERALASGYGERCRRRIARAARSLMDSGLAVAERAAELLEDGAAVPHGHRGVWLIPSAREEGRAYLAHPNGCTCPAGLHQCLCCHRIAATILAAG